MSAVYRTNRCNSEESDNAVQDLYWIGGDISFERANKPFRDSDSCAQLAVLDQSLNLCYRFALLAYQKVRHV